MYTGVTNNLERRLCEHYFGINQTDAFTKKYQCYYLVWFERFQYIDDAINTEKRIKGWVRQKQIKLIETEDLSWRFLNKDIMKWPPISQEK